MRLSAINGNDSYRVWAACDISVKIDGELSNNRYITAVDTSGGWYEKYVTTDNGCLAKDAAGEPFTERVKCDSIEVIINDKHLVRWIIENDDDPEVVDYFKKQQ